MTLSRLLSRRAGTLFDTIQVPFQEGRAIFRHYFGPLRGGPGHFLDLRNSCAPPVLQTSVVPAPQFEGSRTPNMLLPGCRNALWRSKVYKTGEKSIFGPFPGGGGGFQSQKGLPTASEKILKGVDGQGAFLRLFWYLNA